MKLSDNLKRIRKENSLSQEQLAEKLGVSRQAVSKWESGQSYPEMDKVLLICKLFGYKIDELMNENVKEVDENKQSKNNINKYIDDFFDFITKTVDMLTLMTFKQKAKCILEQFIVGIILFIIFGMFGSIVFNILENILGGFLRLTNILSSIYGVFALIIGIIILLHIFKIRYLDYYEIIKEEKVEERIGENKLVDNEKNKINKDEKITLEKKKQKVIIRDPAHSEAKFLNGIIKIIITFIKFIAIWFGFFFAISFLGLISILVLSFLFVKTGLFFIGCFIGIISLIVINFIVLQILYNFIVNKRNPKLKIAIGILSSLIAGGISIGILLIGITNFNYIENDSNFNKQDEYIYEMKENLSINSNIGNLVLEYIESDLEDVKLIIKHSEYTKVTNIIQDNNTIDLWCEPDNTKVTEFFRKVIEDINNKKVQDFSKFKVYIYASKENIEKLKNNRNKKYEESLKSEINNLENKNFELEQKIEILEDELEEKDTLIYDLKEELREVR